MRSRPVALGWKPAGSWFTAPSTKHSNKSALQSWKPKRNELAIDQSSRLRRMLMLATADYLAAIPDPTFPACGRLTRSVGLLLESTGAELSGGTLVKVSDHKSGVVCEVVGFRDERLLMLAIEET